MLAKRYNVVQMRQFFSSKSCVRLLSLPMRGEWIEIPGCCVPDGLLHPSLPMRGEWIEISSVSGLISGSARLSPCGESGLKSRADAEKVGLVVSLPMRGEWIEIDMHVAAYARNRGLSPCGESGLKSLPIQSTTFLAGLSPCGESGLKSSSPSARTGRPSLSPCGESGLKLKGFGELLLQRSVSPHAGRVD